MKTDCFYIWSGYPVTIEELLKDNMVKIKHIQLSCRDKERFEVVHQDHLTEMTEKLAVTNINKLCKLRDQAAGKYNLVIHAYENCLRYM